jgi:hypothetical protein
MSLKQCMHLVLATVILLRCLVWSGAFGYVPPPGEMLGSSTSGGAPADAPKREDGGRVSRASGRRSTVAHVYSVLASSAYTAYFFVVLFLSVTAAAFEVREHLGTSENR